MADLGVVCDILVNNAGFSTLGRISESDPDDEMRMVELDVNAVVDLTVRFLPGMVERDRGGVLNVASTAGLNPLPGQAGYGACKAFVVSYTRSLVAELRGSNVAASALCPGPVDTGFGEAAGFTKEEAEKALPPVMWVPSADVARAGVEGLAKGKPVVVPGAAMRATATLTGLLPAQVMANVVARAHPGLR